MRKFHEYCLEWVFADPSKKDLQDALGILFSFHYPRTEIAGVARLAWVHQDETDWYADFKRSLLHVVHQTYYSNAVLRATLRAKIERYRMYWVLQSITDLKISCN